MKQEIIDIIRKFYLTNEIKTYDQCAEEILRLFSVGGSFSQKDMENFAAKCMLFDHQGKTTSELLKDFCDNDR